VLGLAPATPDIHIHAVFRVFPQPLQPQRDLFHSGRPALNQLFFEVTAEKADTS
jgi:hypothetical protein